MTTDQDDAMQIREALRRQIQELFQVEHRQNPAAHIDNANQKRRSAWYRRQIFQRMNFLYTAALDRIPFLGQAKFQYFDSCCLDGRRRLSSCQSPGTLTKNLFGIHLRELDSASSVPLIDVMISLSLPAVRPSDSGRTSWSGSWRRSDNAFAKCLRASVNLLCVSARLPRAK